MAEIFAIVQASTQLLEQSFRILKRLRTAHSRQKNLVDVLGRHEQELNNLKSIIGIIDDEQALQTVAVGEEIVRLKAVQRRLVSLLEGLDPKSASKASQFAHQLTHGSSDEKKLAVIMTELGHVKSALLLRIQVAHVGVMRTVEKQIVANAEVIKRIDDFLREEVGDAQGLRIARLLKDRRPSYDGTVPLTLADLRALEREDEDVSSTDETVVDDGETPARDISIKTERIILRNVARNQALQINAALGEDIWKDMTRLVIRDNVAEDHALQINHGTSLEVGLMLLDRQDKRVAMSRVVS